MMAQLKNTVLFILLCAGLVFAIKMMFSTPATRYHSDDELKRTRDFYMMNVEAKNFDKTGNLSLHMHAQQVDHYPDNNTSQIQQPHIRLYKDQQREPLIITAKHASATQGTEHVTLRDDVHISQPPTKTRAQLDLKTQEIHYYPKKKYAQCDTTVHIDQGGLSVVAQGLSAQLDAKQLQLRHPKAHYEKLK